MAACWAHIKLSAQQPHLLLKLSEENLNEWKYRRTTALKEHSRHVHLVIVYSLAKTVPSVCMAASTFMLHSSERITNSFPKNR